MGQTFSNLLTHIVYSTKDRAPLITPTIRPRLYAYIGGILRDLDCTIVEVGGVEDHIHLLVLYPPKIAVADLVGKVKANASRWAANELGEFSWQNGYAAFSVSESAKADVRKYLLDQEEHHRSLSFKEELLRFLERHGIAHNEEFIWD